MGTLYLYLRLLCAVDGLVHILQKRIVRSKQLSDHLRSDLLHPFQPGYHPGEQYYRQIIGILPDPGGSVRLTDYPEPESIAEAHQRGLKVSEVPVSMNERIAGESSIHKLSSIYYMVKVTLAILITGSIRH